MDRLAKGAEDVEEEEVRPGLRMRITRTLKDDGRYLLYYDFCHDVRPEAAPPREEPGPAR